MKNTNCYIFIKQKVCRNHQLLTFKAMLSIIKHIEKVDISFSEKKLVPELPHLHPANQKIPFEVPLVFFFNELWKVHHDCNCGQTVSFSLKNNWNPLIRLFSRFRSIRALETFSLAFESLKLIKTHKSRYTYLTNSTFNNLQANELQIPEIRFNYYQCEHCCREYLCQIYEGIPVRPSREYHTGRNGRLSIPEIAQIEWNGEGTLIEFLESEYSEPEL